MRAAPSALQLRVKQRITQIRKDSRAVFKKKIMEPGVRSAEWENTEPKFKIYGEIRIQYVGDHCLIHYKILKKWENTGFHKNPIVEDVTEKVTLTGMQKLGNAIKEKIDKSKNKSTPNVAIPEE